MSIRKLGLLALGSALIGYLSGKGGGRRSVGLDAKARGRLVSKPQQMTWLGWKDVLYRSWNEMFEDRLLSVAAAVAFYSLLSLVPALSVLISIYGLIADPATITDRLAPFLHLMPPMVQELVVEQSIRLATKPAGNLSFNLLLSLAVAGWSANAAVKAMFEALNIIYDETEKRSILRYNLVTLATTLSGVIIMVLVFALIAVVPAALALFPFRSVVETLINLLRWPVLMAVSVLGIMVLYRIAPSRVAPKWRWLWPGALFASFVWMLASLAFSAYVARLGDYSATYGSLAAVVVFMTWLWLSATIVLLGAEINSELEHQTMRDTTAGLPKPIGMRGAVMADNIGPPVAKK
jgi:membrane protein